MFGYIYTNMTMEALQKGIYPQYFQAAAKPLCLQIVCITVQSMQLWSRAAVMICHSLRIPCFTSQTVLVM